MAWQSERDDGVPSFMPAIQRSIKSSDHGSRDGNRHGPLLALPPTDNVIALRFVFRRCSDPNRQVLSHASTPPSNSERFGSGLRRAVNCKPLTQGKPAFRPTDGFCPTLGQSA